LPIGLEACRISMSGVYRIACTPRHTHTENRIEYIFIIARTPTLAARLDIAVKCADG